MVFCLSIIIKSCVTVREQHLAGSLAMVFVHRARALLQCGAEVEQRKGDQCPGRVIRGAAAM